MRGRFVSQAALGILLIWQFSACLGAETADPNETSKYLNAVREFGDNVLKYGRDTYGPKHTPLFVDGLNIHTHEPVKWISPDGEKWVLSNLASQQNLFRTLDGLSTITGDPKYKQAAMEAIEYAFANLRSRNGLIYWGINSAYDAQTDRQCGKEVHSLKCNYPYYELMWEVDSNATKQFIESFWSAHILDWVNLDMNRLCFFNEDVEEAWNHEYKRYPTFFKSKLSWGFGPLITASSLIHAGITLTKLSGEEQPFIWSRRLLGRYIDARHPKTGISKGIYNNPRFRMGEDLKEHFVDPYTTFFPYIPFVEFKYLYYPEDMEAHPWLSIFLVGEMLGEEGEEFTRWALEELIAWGKASYRKNDNSFVPILTDGTNLEGYVWKNAPGTGSEGLVVKAIPADMPYFWAYSVAYHMTGDEFMWEMVRDIARGNNLGDIGETPSHTPNLKINTTCFHVYGLLGFLELYEKTHRPEYLQIAQHIGDNILANEFHKGFFVLSKRHLYASFDYIEPLALLHLDLAMKRKTGLVPRVWPNIAIFTTSYRHKEEGIDRRDIYTLTESSEPPLSLQEAVIVEDVNMVSTLVEKGISVESLDDSSFQTALHRAARVGHTKVTQLLLDEGAKVNAIDWGCCTPLHYAIEGGYNEIVALLLEHGADVNLKNNTGQTPLDIALSKGNKEIIKLLLDKGAKITSLHQAVQLGDLAIAKALFKQGAGVNVKDKQGRTVLF
ncbi:MAG: ankyrin repeat domain-containing protein [Phycisphaerae bacterium]|nr:ankyrin repeat domain-containing protein [Phycisphaerae bacterium]